VGPEEHDHGLTYHSPAITFEILYNHHSQEVETLACGLVGDRSVHARLTCLLPTAKLGPAQLVKTTARTNHTLATSLRSQAEATKRLLPPLQSSDRDDLLLACHRR
jgi:hypothetical protein